MKTETQLKAQQKQLTIQYQLLAGKVQVMAEIIYEPEVSRNRFDEWDKDFGRLINELNQLRGKTLIELAGR